jgi:hypothetical protein
MAKITAVMCFLVQARYTGNHFKRMSYLSTGIEREATQLSGDSDSNEKMLN